MKKQIKVIISVFLLLVIGIVFYIYQKNDFSITESGGAIEFGNAEDRQFFISLLKNNQVSYTITTDYLNRTWVVPNKAKLKEYEATIVEYEQIRAKEVKKANEER